MTTIHISGKALLFAAMCALPVAACGDDTGDSSDAGAPNMDAGDDGTGGTGGSTSTGGNLSSTPVDSGPSLPLGDYDWGDGGVETADDCTKSTFEGHNYTYCEPSVTWIDAAELCEDAGMYLVRVDSEAENDFVAGLAGAESPTGADTWLGGTDMDEEGVWKWVDNDDQFWMGDPLGEAVGGLYTNWNVSEPDNMVSPGGNCLRMPQGEGKAWRDTPCEDPGFLFGFVCESD